MKREEYIKELRMLYRAALEQLNTELALDILERLRTIDEPMEVLPEYQKSVI